LTLPYGDGVAGKAYKNNRHILWQKHQSWAAPDFYHSANGDTRHEFLLACPMQNPLDDRYAYGVVCMGSEQPFDFTPQHIEKLKVVQSAVSQICARTFQSQVAKEQNEAW